ncbi:transcriptional regulator, partial [Fischerella muscicola CCMEE 5323]
LGEGPPLGRADSPPTTNQQQMTIDN